MEKECFKFRKERGSTLFYNGEELCKGRKLFGTSECKECPHYYIEYIKRNRNNK